MMRDMRGPEQPADMIYPVQPVIHEVFKYQQHYPVYPRIGDGLCDAVVIKERKDEKKINSAEEQVDACIQQHQVNILYRILPGIAFLFAGMTEKKFQSYHNKIDWCADKYQ